MDRSEIFDTELAHHLSSASFASTALVDLLKILEEVNLKASIHSHSESLEINLRFSRAAGRYISVTRPRWG